MWFATQNRSIAVKERHGHDAHARGFEWAPSGLDGNEIDLRDAAPFGRAGVEDVAEHLANLTERPGVAIAGNRAALQAVVAAHLVEADDVVGVSVRIKNRVHPRDAEAQRLHAQVRPGLDQQPRAVALDVNRRPQPLVARVRRATPLS